MRIYLWGFMASGKSTIAKALQPLFPDFSVIDIDTEIELIAGKSIPEIFSEDGEDKFRAIEQQAIQNSTQLTNVIIATGGGSPCFFNNAELMKSNGYCIYLHAGFEILTERIEIARAGRPMANQASIDELAMLYITRSRWYDQAHYTCTETDIPSILKDIQPLIQQQITR